jgi:methyltransferase
MTIIAYAILLAVAAQRLVEMAWARRNTRRLMEKGAVEAAPGHYPFIVAMHASWFAAMALFLPKPVVILPLPLIVFVALQCARVWVMATLGSYFTTRIITLPGTALVRSGPYRFVRHPNYLVVAGEILVLPLVFGETAVAVVFSILNAIVLAWRIRAEDAALAPRRSAL